MAPETYSLEQFVADLDRITDRESAPAAITAQVAPLLGRLVRNDAAIPAPFRGRGPDGGRGRFMLHRAPRFNVTAVTWRPGGRAVRSVTRHRAGAISVLVPPDDEVHAMYNPTGRDTVEIHVYGRDLHGLPRKTWAADGRVSPLVSPQYLNC